MSASSSTSLPSSPPSFSPPNWKYDVFPSVHADIRKAFLPRVMSEFRIKGIDTFIDNEIKRNNSIGPELIKAIRRSKIAIVILSRNYASSTRCLNELVEIIRCKEELGQVLMPIYYNLDPSDIKKLSGDFGKIFKKTCLGETKENIGMWSEALEKVATINGYHSRNCYNEAAMIETVATDIANKLNSSTFSSDLKDLVGIKAHMKYMEPMLCPDSDEVRMIGIWGPHGIGKTTIARVLFSQLSHQFQLTAFMGNIRASYSRYCLDEYGAKLQLQYDFMYHIFNQKDISIPHLGVMQERLRDKKVLVVLDDVDSLAQLDAMANNTRWFGPGSRIIITTQDQRILMEHGINHIYKVNFPSPDEALQIFCMYSFGQKYPKDGLAKVALEVTNLAGKNPLGLMVMGSYLRGVSELEWKLVLLRLRTSLDGEIGSIMKFTYDRESFHRHLSYLRDGELTERMEKYLTKGFSEVRKRTITNQEDLYTSETAFKGISNRLLHAVYIYCADALQYSFASHLSMDFRRKGISPFVICNETLEVIEGAYAIVVVFSKSCFSSHSWLLRVLLCRRRTGQLVVPVFYGISPSDVVVQEHELADRIEWISILQELRALPGHQSREECNECEFVEEIVKDVCGKISPTEQIGINSRLLELEKLLCKQQWGIRRIGIWGMPGIGKTTLAKAFFDQISGDFEASCFIKQFDKKFHEKGLHRLLEENFGRILKELPQVWSSIMRPSLPKKRTLVVLDDVHNPLFAESFLERFPWFGPGSLIIIISRDKQIFRFCQIKHVYEVQSLKEAEALQLFSHCAFGKYIREQNLLELSVKVIDYANGNPLALIFYGRELKGKKLSEMETTFLKLKLRTPYKIHDLFKSSYEALNYNEKNIFLDIACFFNGENVAYLMPLLEGCGFFPHVGIDALVEKCLVTISENRVQMHRLIQDFGREIINGETIQIERRRRLWEPWTIKFLLEDEAHGDPKATYTRALGTEDIEGIFLDTANLLFDVKPTAFENMLNLRFLSIYCSNDENLFGLGLPNGLESLPYMLRFLRWEDYPLHSLPEDFDPCYLVQLDMPYSQLQKLWRGTKNLDMLKRVRLGHSQQLTEIDNVCQAQNIELIDLEGCTKLQSFPATCQLQHLRVVNLSGCKGIKILPEVSTNIQELHLQGTSISELPMSIGNATNLKKLCLTGCLSLVELPSSIGNATNLEELNLGYCSSLVKLPSSIGNATNLKELYLTGCSRLVELPTSIGKATNLTILDLTNCSSLVELPASIGNAKNLKKLCLTGCSSLVELPSAIRNAISLQELNLETSLVELPSIRNATELEDGSSNQDAEEIAEEEERLRQELKEIEEMKEKARRRKEAITEKKRKLSQKKRTGS